MDTIICSKTPTPILATGGISYAWSPASGLSNPNIPNPLASPVSTTSYTVKVTNAAGCSKEEAVRVAVNPVPVITTSNDTLICRNTPVKLFISGGASYAWTPLSGVDNSSSSSPMVSPTSTTTYYVTIFDAFSCTHKDSIKISVHQPAVFSVSPNSSVCMNSPFELSASGGTTYSWQPTIGLNNPNISNPTTVTNASTTYSVTITENVCNESATLSTVLTALALPTVIATKSNDVNCSFPNSNLKVTGAQSYTWTPATGLNNAAIENPVATPANTLTYTVTGKDNNGCENTDNITVEVLANTKTVYELPNSFTPNGDGINDCFGIGYWGVVQELDFSIYNRFGQKVFYTNEVSRCWDGKFNGQLQGTGVFIYIVKAKTACGIIDRKGTVLLLK